MNTHKSLLLALALLFFLVIRCDQKESKNKTELASIDLYRGKITLCGNQDLGDVNFSVSCNDKSREAFNLAISLLHSFEYEEAEKAFVKAIEADPQCVMAYWGVAMSNFHSLWLQAGTGYLKKGNQILAIAKSLTKSEKEQDYLDAIHVFYKDWESIDRNKRKLLYKQKMEELYKKYPDDTEAAIFYALALNAIADPTDKTYENQKKAGAILEALFQSQPNHPGIAHYIIHSYDYPELAALALPTARKYALIAPASAHAQHMPSHIFTRLGLWDESIGSNLNSTASALCYGKSIDPEGHWDEELHGMDYLVYAYLQKGENGKAKEQQTYLQSFQKTFPVTFKVAYATAAIPSRIALENKNWKKAANLQVLNLNIDWKSFPWQKSIVHFTRALGAVHVGNTPSSEKELNEMKLLWQQLIDRGDQYQADQVQIQIMSAEAWIHFAKGHKQEGISLMKEAAHKEYNTAKHSVTPGEVLPAGELLGDMLMANSMPSDALNAYEYDLQQHPNRFNGLYGAALAAKTIGDRKKATHYFEVLLSLTKNSTTVRPEIKDALAYVGR
jgi:tetratricopeptide (TPR) repeat protein